ncbi:transposase [Clostridium massiliamazoniense]
MYKKGRNPAVEPLTMLKIIVYAYMKGIYSSRKIEDACKRNLDFI